MYLHYSFTNEICRLSSFIKTHLVYFNLSCRRNDWKNGILMHIKHIKLQSTVNN